jgi:D-glycero-alpha-D-manno-heptose-7-phosphate kinase
MNAMIVTRSPLRISLGGGGTDLPSYYREHEGFLIAAAIDKYVYIMLHKRFVPQILLKYSQLEEVDAIEDVRHPLIREALRLTGADSYIEIASMADVPAGTGLGSSGSFTTGLLKALHSMNRTIIGSAELAEQACAIEIDRLGEPVGKQDQYIASFGGLTCFTFARDGSVTAEPLNITRETLANLEDNLILFYTGISRSAGAILQEQQTRTVSNDAAMIENLHFVKKLGLQSRDALEQGNLWRFAELMNVHWQYKRERSGKMTNAQVDDWYELGRRSGAMGGKLIGAGGGGFLMFYTEDKVRLRHAMIGAGLQEMRFRFDFEGTKLLFS